ncbi:MAG: phage portal protein [Ruminiclostridium sp.]|nr:phage portal protein [Ruminiclostridium sp.]
MLTNLNWLKSGAEFPPVSEKERIETYKENAKLFRTKHSEVYKEFFEELTRRLHLDKADKIRTILNYHQLLSKKTADFVCSEPPTLETEDDTDELIRRLEKTQWAKKLYEGIIDISRYGNAVFKFIGQRVSVVDPKNWFPIVDPADLKEIVGHVIAYPTETDTEGKPTQLYVEIHDIGRIETRLYQFDSDKGVIGALISSKNNLSSIPDDFAVQILSNVTESGSIYGIDDYSAINSLISSIMWRIQRIDTVLNKHSEPSVSGPSSALTWDEHFQRYYLDFGKFYARDNSTDPDVKYITWDGNLTSAFQEIEMLMDQLYIISEMGQAFALGKDGGGESSGTALKLRLISPRIKAARIVANNDAAVKRIISIFAELNGIKLNYDNLQLHWKDGIPVDEREQIETLQIATGGKPVMSQYSAMKQRGLSDKDVETELEQLADEAAAVSPVALTAVDSFDETEDSS